MKLHKMFLIFKGCFPYNQILLFLFFPEISPEKIARGFFFRFAFLFLLYFTPASSFIAQTILIPYLLFFPLKFWFSRCLPFPLFSFSLSPICPHLFWPRYLMTKECRRIFHAISSWIHRLPEALCILFLQYHNI